MSGRLSYVAQLRWAFFAFLALGLLLAAGVVAFTWAGYAADTRCYPLLFPSPNHGPICRDLDREHAMVGGGLAVVGLAAAIAAGVLRSRLRRPTDVNF